MSHLDLTINDRYRLIQKLGEGGMGEVYLAEDLTMLRQVAIKFIRGLLGDPESYNRLLTRFQREARTLAKFSHPNIVHVYDYGDYEGRPYLVMEYLPGGSLADRMGTPMPWQEACSLGAKIAKALQYAHGEGILHRDIKPSNILFTSGGEPVVSDFGLAHVMDTSSANEGSLSGSYSLLGGAPVVGTPEYMAPEQWGGKATEQSDVYSLGVVLFQMLTGQVPYPGKTPGEVIANLAINPVPQPRALNVNIPKNLESIVQKALARDPQNRFAGMAEVYNTLTHTEKGEAGIEAAGLFPNKPPVKRKEEVPSKAKPEKGSPPTLAKKGMSQTLLFVLGGIALVVLLISGVTNGWFESKANKTSNSEAVQLPEVAIPAQTITSPPKPTYTSLPTNTPYPLPPTENLKIGLTWVSPMDGMPLVYVPGGTFTMGATVDEAYAECRKLRNDCTTDWFTNETPPHEVTLTDFWIDQTEVTNSMYRGCVQYGPCSEPLGTNSKTQETYYGLNAYADYPVIYVNWQQATTYCEWSGRQLPTEAQWEYAARGPERNTYPWGNDLPTCDKANYHRANGGGYCTGETWVVGSHTAGKSWVDAYDMAGNVWEWVQDVYAPYSPGAETNPLVLGGGEKRVIRGGSFEYNVMNTRSSNRSSGNPDLSYYHYGFRCAISINPIP